MYPIYIFQIVFERKNVRSYVDCGVIDGDTHTTPDVFAIMASFNIVWTKERRLWFISEIGEALNEYSKKGQIDESLFDKLCFTLDKDDKGMDYPLVNPIHNYFPVL